MKKPGTRPQIAQDTPSRATPEVIEQCGADGGREALAHVGRENRVRRPQKSCGPPDLRPPRLASSSGTSEEQITRRITAERLGHHWEIANLVAYVMSVGGPYQTGDRGTIDGGRQPFSGQTFAWLATLGRAEAKRLLSGAKPRK